jgi:sarcosine oxidase, subunit gamma
MNDLDFASPVRRPVVIGPELSIVVAQPAVMLELCLRNAGISSLPARPNTALAVGSTRLLWLRPDRWLLVSDEDHRDAQRQWAALGAMVCDVSCGRVRFGITGPAAQQVLAKGTPLDLRPSRFAPGSCAQTQCAGFAVLLDRREDGFDLYVDAPLAAACEQWLIAAGGEFGKDASP